MTLFKRLFLLTVFAFSLPNYPGAGYLGFLGRYGSLVALALALFIGIRGGFKSRGVTRILPFFGLFILQCLLTGFWTENFSLTILKLFVFTLSALGLFIGAVRFNQAQGEDKNPFLPLAFVFIPAVLTCIPAYFTGTGFLGDNFRGWTGNANTLGAMIALSSPWLLFELNRGLGKGRRRWGLLVLAVLALYFLLLTYSRSSMIACAVIVLSSIRGMNLTRRLAIIYSVAFVLVLVFVTNEGLYRSFYQAVVLKRAEKVTTSRTEQMATSWEAAKQGGWIGKGFGISVGQSRYWTFGSFSRSSREKGSSQMAILEETGIVGFALYLLFMASILSCFLRARRNGASGFSILLASGFLLAAIIHSMFEAWFLSTGPEMAFFWTGIGLCLGRIERTESAGRSIALSTAPSMEFSN